MAGKWANVTVTVKGMEEVSRLLDRAQLVASPKLIQRYATLPAAKIIRDDAKRRVRKGKGLDVEGKPRQHLADLIFAAGGHGRDGSAIAGVDYHKAPHAHLLELGTKPHDIVARKGRGISRSAHLIWMPPILRWVKKAKHPGIQKSKTAFLRPAVRKTKKAVAKRMEEGLRRLLYDVLNQRQVSP